MMLPSGPISLLNMPLSASLIFLYVGGVMIFLILVIGCLWIFSTPSQAPVKINRTDDDILEKNNKAAKEMLDSRMGTIQKKVEEIETQFLSIKSSALAAKEPPRSLLNEMDMTDLKNKISLLEQKIVAMPLAAPLALEELADRLDAASRKWEETEKKIHENVPEAAVSQEPRAEIAKVEAELAQLKAMFPQIEKMSQEMKNIQKEVLVVKEEASKNHQFEIGLQEDIQEIKKGVTDDAGEAARDAKLIQEIGELRNKLVLLEGKTSGSSAEKIENEVLLKKNQEMADVLSRQQDSAGKIGEIEAQLMTLKKMLPQLESIESEVSNIKNVTATTRESFVKGDIRLEIEVMELKKMFSILKEKISLSSEVPLVPSAVAAPAPPVVAAPAPPTVPAYAEPAALEKEKEIEKPAEFLKEPAESWQKPAELVVSSQATPKAAEPSDRIDGFPTTDDILALLQKKRRF